MAEITNFETYGKQYTLKVPIPLIISELDKDFFAENYDFDILGVGNSEREAVEELWRIKDDLATVKHILGCKGDCEIENRIQEVRGVIRIVAEGE